MGIQTSQITTSSDGDLSLNPAGTGKVVLPDLSGSGEVPMAVDTDGKVKPLDEREFSELSAIDPGDNIMVQRGTDYYRIDATNLGGLGLADPQPPADVEWYPSTPPGSGTQSDPYVLTSATVYVPGGTATSVESCQIIGQKPDSLVLISEVGGKVGVRMDQPGQICDNNGKTPYFNFGYVDAPNSTSGQDYDGLMRIGQSSIYVKWVVTQVANNTSFGPASSPNASPTTVNYAADGKYGTVTATWADGDQTPLTATNMVFSVDGGTMDGSPKNISDGSQIAIGFVDSEVASASEGDTITGNLSGSSYYAEFSMVKNTVPAPFTIQPRTDQSASAETTTGNEPVKGINAPTTITATGSSANQLTNTGASINGGGAVASGTFNPGDSLQGYGTTGASNNTTYQATFTVGGVSSTWDVTTSDAVATIGQPIITSPANGSADLVPDVVLTGSAYDSQGANAHNATTWEVYEADAGTSVSPSITTTDGESPLTLSGPAPAGLRDKVVMVDSTSPTVEGDKTQPTPYTLTTSTITNVVTSGPNLELTFAATNPDLKYFRPGDVAQDRNAPWNGITDWSKTCVTENNAGNPIEVLEMERMFDSDLENTSRAVYDITINDINLDGVAFVEMKANGAAQGWNFWVNDVYQTQQQIESGTHIVSATGEDLIPGGTLNKFRFQCANTNLDIWWIRFKMLDGQVRYLLDSGATQTGTEVYEVVSVDVANNKMVVDGGLWLGSDGTTSGVIWNQSQVWSGQWSGTFWSGYTARDMYSIADSVNSDALAAANSTVTWTPVGVTFSDELVVYARTFGKAGASITANFLDGTTITINSEDTSSEASYLPYVLKSGGGTLTSFTASTGADSTEAFWISEWRADNERLMDAGEIGDQSGKPVVTLGITGVADVAATNGAEVTLTNVQGRWVGSGSENKAGKTFYVATVEQDGAPGAPSNPVDTGKYTAITPSATTLTTATLDDSNLNEGKFYYSRVKYGDGSIESDFSEYNEFGTADAFVTEPITWIGDLNTLAVGSYHAIAYGNGVFTCVDPSGKGSFSTDGKSWSASTGIGRAASIAYGDGVFIAPNNHGGSEHWDSPDGENWTRHSGPIDVNFAGNAITYGNGMFVSAGYSKGNNPKTAAFAYTTDKGSTWTMLDMGASYTDLLNGIAYDGSGKWIAVGRAGATFTSTNGTSWTAGPKIANKDFYGISYMNGTWVATGYDAVYYSTNDGASWTKSTCPTPSGSQPTYRNVANNGTYFVAVNNNGSNDFKAIYSDDGVNWFASDTSAAPNIRFTSVAYGGGLFAGVGESSGYPYAMHVFS